MSGQDAALLPFPPTVPRRRRLPVFVPALPKVSRPDEWVAPFMTVCIAATSTVLGAIVTVSDMMLSTDVDSIEAAVAKFYALVRGPEPWLALYAGDPSQFDELRRHIETKLAGHPPQKTVPEVIAAVEKAYDKLIEHAIEREILSRYQMKRSAFLATGLKKLGPDVFFQIDQEMRQLMITMRDQDPTELIICGFERGEPHIIHVNGIGKCTLHDGYGYCAIGIGSSAARGWLNTYNTFRHADDIREIAYRLCEAKFASETAPGVGQRTTVLAVILHDGFSDAMMIRQPKPSEKMPPPRDRMQQLIARRGVRRVPMAREVIRDAWEAHRNQPLPEKALESIGDGLTKVIPRIKQWQDVANAKPIATQPPPSDQQRTEDREAKKRDQ